MSQKQNMDIFLEKLLSTAVQTGSGPESQRITLHLSRKSNDTMNAAFCLPEMILKLLFSNGNFEVDVLS